MFLKVKQSDNVTRAYKFYKRRHLTIGRWKNNHIILEDPTVSGHHARIDSIDGKFFMLNDLDSRNGTHINGQAIVSQGLKNNDVITIGNSTLIYEHKNLEREIDEIESKRHSDTVTIIPEK